MNKLILSALTLLLVVTFRAQSPGDTIVVKAFKYGSNSRDTLINFPSGNLTFEKIIMKYNMRCKNALVSTGSQPNLGCGEWDASCSTFIIDSTKIETDARTHPSHIIPNFSGNNFVYTSQTTYDYYNYNQTNVTLNSIISETQHTLGIGSVASNLLKTDEKSGRAQLLYTAAELTAAGLTAGNIDGFMLSVANAGGDANFFKVGIQHVSNTLLNASTPIISGFTNVYNHQASFVSGNNRIQFHTPFVWNGTSNLLLDLSFTNTNPSTPIIFNGTNISGVTALYAKNNYALNLSNLGHVMINTTMLSSISNQMSISFWAYGKSSMAPSGNVILNSEGANIESRQLLVHLPYFDNSVYFDCGQNLTGFDRINKVATAAEQGGQWNHWVFTKNATTGTMRIYLNGALWHSGTGKTKPISILNLILGKYNDLSQNYKGKINELTIWNKELVLADIQPWMNKPIDNTHPFYSNLLGYYKMDEGNGLTVTDSKNNLNSTGVNLQWTYDRGNDLTRMFSETNVRPNIVFVRGTYSITANMVTIKDSIARNPNFIQQYTIVSTASVTPAISDQVNLVSTTSVYEATPQNIYNGDTGALIGTIATTPQATLNITNLNYNNRYPFYNQIMSFVTPYGIGLNLGSKGKTWYYDVTDFTPLLKGPKRLLMTLGGEYYEQMDIDFWFIVGTPPRNVLEFNQLWQGAARLNGTDIDDINNDVRFDPINVTLPTNAQQFKIRSIITGHGAEGEFKQNGGPVDHFINIDGGPEELTWSITQSCAFNPVFPQGGTWIYDREGWCPGQSSLIKEHDITPFVVAGNTVTLDYNCSAPPNPAGNYNYLVTHQLVSYGGANHALDASIIDVLAPSNKVLYSRKNPICANPIILIQNTGSTLLTKLEIDYWVNNATSKQTYTWTGSLTFMDTATVILPINTLWQNGLLPTNNVFKAQLKKANSTEDGYAFNNTYTSPFVIPAVIPSEFSVEFKTNNNYVDNSYKIIDEAGTIVGSSSFTAANTLFSDSYVLNGCYKLIVEDAGRDGVQWWANPSQGSGYVQIRNNSGMVVKSFQSDFGGGFEYSFTTDGPLSLEKNFFGSNINLYPNPSHHKFVLEGAELEGAELLMTDVLGRSVDVTVVKNGIKREFNTSTLKPGVYMLSITKNNNKATKKVIVN
jgi:hypothetical protein